MDVNLSKLSGQDLFEYYTSKGGEYASALGQAYGELDKDLFVMLEECERTGKHIVIKEDMEDVIDSPVTISVENLIQFV